VRLLRHDGGWPEGSIAAAAIFGDIDLCVSRGGNLVCFPGVGWWWNNVVKVVVDGGDVVVVVLVERAFWGCTGVLGRWVDHDG